MGEKKAELIKEVKELKAEAELWKKRYLAEKEKAEKSFLAENDELRHLKSTLAYQQNLNDMNKTLASIKEQENMRLKEENRQLLEDNEKFFEDFKGRYRMGVADRERQLNEILSKEEEWTKYQIEKQKKEIAELKDKNQKLEATVAYLKTLINDRLYDSNETGKELEKIYKRIGKPGKMQIDEETQNRIRKLRLEGFSMRKIAEMEHLSVGYVHKVIHKAG